jgi:3-methyladenine DNA glycosylase AlkD
MFKFLLSGGVGGAIGYSFFKYKGQLKAWFNKFNQKEPHIIIKTNLKIKDRNDKLLGSSFKISHQNANSKMEFI